jgi:heme-degrading monooxygenase HmoA
MFHVAASNGNGLRITDVWESAEDFQNFVESRLMPGVKQLGIEGEPKVEIYPAHRIFAPAYEK